MDQFQVLDRPKTVLCLPRQTSTKMYELGKITGHSADTVVLLGRITCVDRFKPSKPLLWVDSLIDSSQASLVDLPTYA